MLEFSLEFVSKVDINKDDEWKILHAVLVWLPSSDSVALPKLRPTK